MATRHFDKTGVGVFPESLLPSTFLMSGYAAPLRLIRPQYPATGAEQCACGTSSNLEVSNIGRCIRWAVAIEGGAALVVYATWAVLRLVL